MIFLTVLICLVVPLVILSIAKFHQKQERMSIRLLSLWLSITLLFFYEFIYFSIRQRYITYFYIGVTIITGCLFGFLSFKIYPTIGKDQKDCIVHYYIPFLVILLPLLKYPTITPILILIHYIFIYMRLR